jgi:hypothetical protein
MKRTVLCGIVVAFAVACVVPAGTAYNIPYCGPAPKACAPPPPARIPVARTVNVRVPLPCPPAPRPVCRPPVRCGSPAPAYCAPPPCPKRPKPMPVRVEVSVRPESPCEQRLAPLVWRDPGPLKAVIGSGTALLRAAIAAPFKAAEMLVPCSWKRKCRPLVPPRNQCGIPQPCYPPNMIGCRRPITCAPCPPPMTRAPVGPSVAPLPPASGPAPCGPYIPPRIVRNARFPMFEPGSLAEGIVNLPFRFVGRARVSDFGRYPYPCGPATQWSR